MMHSYVIGIAPKAKSADGKDYRIVDLQADLKRDVIFWGELEHDGISIMAVNVLSPYLDKSSMQETCKKE